MESPARGATPGNSLENLTDKPISKEYKGHRGICSFEGKVWASLLLGSWIILLALVGSWLFLLVPASHCHPEQTFSYLLLIHPSLLNQQNWRKCTPRRCLPPALLLEEAGDMPCPIFKAQVLKLYSQILYIVPFVQFPPCKCVSYTTRSLHLEQWSGLLAGE